MKILVTGITGFVGMNLLKYLKNKDDFTIDGMVKDRYKVIDPSKFGINKLYLLEELKVNGLDHDIIIHLAGKAHDLKKSANNQIYRKANVELSKEIFNLFLKNSKPSLFIFVSTVSLFKSTIKEYIFTEDSHPSPDTIYGKTKYEAEQFMLNSKRPSDKRLVILRPSIIYGNYGKGNMTLLFRYIKSGLPYPFGKFQNQRSFLSIGNFCFLIHSIMHNKIKDGIYHVSNDETISTNDLVSIMCQAINKKEVKFNVPKKLINAIATIGDNYNLPLNSERLRKLTNSFIVKNDKIKEELNIAELPESTSKSLLHYFSTFLK